MESPKQENNYHVHFIIKLRELDQIGTYILHLQNLKNNKKQGVGLQIQS